MHCFLKTLLLLSFIVFVVGCNGEKTGPTIQFDSQTWQLVGPTGNHGDIIVVGMSAQEYTNKNDERRLVEFLPTPNSDQSDQVLINRLVSIQSRGPQGNWVGDGLQGKWYVDGRYTESPFKNGELHGTLVAWHANGELSHDRQYQNGKMHGTEYGWYENGDHRYESENVNGEVRSYTAWDESGNVTDSETYWPSE